MSTMKKGYVQLISLKKHGNRHADIAAKADEHKLIKLWEKLGFKVNSKLNIENKEDYIQEINNIRNMKELNDAGLFIFFDLTIQSNSPDDDIPNGEIIGHFTYHKCISLGETPKIFFFQSYADYHSPLSTLSQAISPIAKDSLTAYIPECSDIILAFIDMSGGSVPVTDPNDGSLFIKGLCKSIEEASSGDESEKEDLESTLKRVARYLKSDDAYGFPVFIYENWGIDKLIYL